MKVGLFRIKSTKGLVNYELELLEDAKRYLVFYVSLLEKASNTEPVIANFGYETEKNNIYKVEKIL